MDTSIVWEGIFGSFQEACGTVATFEDDVWLKRTAAALQTDLDRLSKGEPSAHAYTNAYVLPAVAALAATPRRILSVLDFGGGMGSGFLALRSTLPGMSIDYHIVELDRVCKVGNELFANEKAAPHFHSAIPKFENELQLVHAGSSLHYIEDWKSQIRILANLGSPYMLLSDIPAGDISTFVSRQNYYGRQIPSWFWNIDEFISAVETSGYRLSMKMPYKRRVLGKYNETPMQNFPVDRQIDCTFHLLFTRSSSAND